MNDAPTTQHQPTTAPLVCPRCAWVYVHDARYPGRLSGCRDCPVTLHKHAAHISLEFRAIPLEPMPEPFQWARQHLTRALRDGATATDVRAAVAALRWVAERFPIHRAALRDLYVYGLAELDGWDDAGADWLRMALVGPAWWKSDKTLEGVRDIISAAGWTKREAKVMRCDGCNVDVPAGDGRCPKCRALLEVRS